MTDHPNEHKMSPQRKRWTLEVKLQRAELDNQLLKAELAHLRTHLADLLYENSEAVGRVKAEAADAACVAAATTEEGVA